jgi:acyl-CoA thioesterase FadM
MAGFPGSKLNTKFHAPARLRDDLVVTAGLADMTRVTFDIEQKIFKDNTDGELLISGIVKAAYLDADSMRPKRIPSTLFGDNQS